MFKAGSLRKLYRLASRNSSTSGTDTQQRDGGPGAAQAHARSRPPFSAIVDKYATLDEVQEALREQGLESSNLIIAVDFTKSNEWTGKRCFGGKSLHSLGTQPNPYEQVIRIISRTLSAFDDDELIPCYGFGCVDTGDKNVFSFLPDDAPLQGLDEVLWRYRDLVPQVRMAGPTSFAPAILQACSITEKSGGKYHILLLVADGQVTCGELLDQYKGVQEQETIDAIVTASKYPLSIVMVGVGDGPWDLMHQFDDQLPARDFDNFQFVNFTALKAVYGQDSGRLEAAFALNALMELPDQYKYIKRLGLLGACAAPVNIAPLFPPSRSSGHRAPAPDPQHQCLGPEAPSMYLCPITLQLMRDPVLAADGRTYERSAIEEWLRGHDTSPFTNVRLPHKDLIPNRDVRSAIEEHAQMHGWC